MFGNDIIMLRCNNAPCVCNVYTLKLFPFWGELVGYIIESMSAFFDNSCFEKSFYHHNNLWLLSCLLQAVLSRDGTRG